MNNNSKKLRGGIGTSLVPTHIKKEKECNCYDCKWNNVKDFGFRYIECGRHGCAIYDKSKKKCAEFCFEKHKKWKIKNKKSI